MFHVHSTFSWFDEESKDKNWTIRDTDNWTEKDWKRFNEATHIKVWRGYTNTSIEHKINRKVNWSHKNCVIIDW